MFVKLFLILMGLVLFFSMFFNQATGLFIGIVGTIIWFCCGEAQKVNDNKDKMQIKNQYEKEKEIEEYWGTVEYWKNK